MDYAKVRELTDRDLLGLILECEETLLERRRGRERRKGITVDELNKLVQGLRNEKDSRELSREERKLGEQLEGSSAAEAMAQRLPVVARLIPGPDADLGEAGNANAPFESTISHLGPARATLAEIRAARGEAPSLWGDDMMPRPLGAPTVAPLPYCDWPENRTSDSFLKGFLKQ